MELVGPHKRPQMELVGGFLQLLDLRLLPLVLLHSFLVAALFLNGIKGIIAGIELRFAV